MNKIVLIFLFSITCISCNNFGFSQNYKNNFTRECIKKASNTITKSDAETYCSCVLERVMTKYTSGNEADKNLLNNNDLEKFVQPCLIY